MKLLIIEDNELNRDMLSRRLQRLGYDTIIAIDGQSGVAAAQAQSPDLIIMDLSLPGMDGWEATRLLKGAGKTRSIPIVALTAHAVSSDREQAIAAGCDDYDTKPVDIQRLVGKIERLLGGTASSSKIAVSPNPSPQVAQPVPAPIAEAPPPPATAPAAKVARAAAAVTGKLLIVEDNELNRDMLSRRLIRLGYEILIAINGEQGVEMARSEKPELILMDMSLPGLDGWEASRLLKADPATRHIAIIALTAHAMTSDRDKAMAAGCDDYDTKPVEMKRLLGKIETWLGRVRS